MKEARFLKACRRREVDRTPVWFMRQAGRYMSVYRELRRKYTLLEICRAPDLAVQVTFQPIRRFDLDAAIIFADILLPLEGLGVKFEFVKGKGPVIAEPLRSEAQIEAVHVFDPSEDLAYVLEAIGIVRRELDPEIALIGFAGGPFTLASYMIQGGSSRHFVETKLTMYRQEKAWHRLMEKLAMVTLDYLKEQAAAGADALQLFDSWVGCLGPEDYRRFVLPYSRLIFDGLKDLEVPTIHFGTGTAGILEVLAEAGGTVLGVDWRVDIASAWKQFGDRLALQGNLDPVALLGPSDLLRGKVEEILFKVGNRHGHIFNLGHGILPATPEENVEAVVGWVQEMTQRR